ncbi:alanine racemase [Pseudoalteromonas denitrificans]|uniref:Alanine racemase n=1 Tax=Pseudoalteromonas denitrificans DSM 6059 TaxID=1123010 RepID=A0A1I1PEF8_9GAMM|nr:alanine racemase [Pseudoalteromonas denitrificans]SFD08076.1 alanine racemase [Pseudoalteromonas denitrificans DSM 6059]
MRLATAEINLTALTHNLKKVRDFASNSKIMAVLKANAYGHGLVQIAQSLNEADAFAVARVDEALALRAGGLVKPIVLLEGFFDKTDLPILLANNFQTIVHNETQLEDIEQCDLGGQLTVWLKIDTGMHRLGIHPSQFINFYQRLSNNPNVNADIKLMTHFACADDLLNTMTQSQIAEFDACIKNMSEEVCLANSAGIVGWQQSHGDWVRPGLMIYGVSPMLEKTGNDHDLKPVMCLKTRLIAIKKIKAGESAGYGANWLTSKDTYIGIAAIGYGDGYPRHANTGTPVMINGRKVPLVGRVSMDMITVDLGDVLQDKVADEVILWGPELPVEIIAKHADTIPYELLCDITPRVDYKYVE